MFEVKINKKSSALQAKLLKLSNQNKMYLRSGVERKINGPAFSNLD
jgi:hypothetical protein